MQHCTLEGSVNVISKKKNSAVSAEGSDAKEQSRGTASAGGKAVDIASTILTFLLSAIIIVAAVLFAFNNSPSKNLFGFRYYTVLTPSMTPTYDVGDIVFVKLTSADDINVDDVITFNPSADSDAYLTHRVYEKIDNYEGTGVVCFRTKGDANDSEDSFLIDEDRVIGVVRFSVPKVGYVIRFVQLRWYFVVPIILLLLIALRLFKMYFTPNDRNGSDSGKGAAESNNDNITEKE